MKACFFVLLCFFSEVVGYSQTGELDRFDCTYSKEIIIPFNSFESKEVTAKPQLNQVVFYTYRDQFTYWYKINAKIDAKISFNVSALNDSDNYAICIYQYNLTDFCNKLYFQKIKPISGPYFVNKAGKSGNPSFTSLQIKKDHFYYISVINTSLNNCGHSLILNYNTDSLKVKAFHTPCKMDISEISVANKIPKEKIKTEAVKTIQSDTNRVNKIKTPEIAVKPKTDSVKSVVKIDSNLFKRSLPIEEKKIEKKEIPQPIIESKLNDVIVSLKLTGVVKDKKSLKLLKYQVSVFNKDSRNYVTVNSDKNDSWIAEVTENTSYKVKCSSVGYKDVELTVAVKDKNEVLEMLLEPLNIGDNFIMKSIYFHPNTFALKKESASDLQKLLNLMNSNPDLVIEIQGHTNGDNRIYKNKAYEQLGEEWNFQGSSKKLSLSRAEAIKKYLVNNGIAEERLVANGIGGKKPIIQDPETMEEGQQNIRVEVIILKN